MSLKGKHIVLGITGSIAAYKACQIIRLLVKREAEVQVVITPCGKEFITPLTLSTLTSNPVICDFFSRKDGSWHSHVDLGIWADAMLIAPATASTLAKMAHGIADNMLTTTYLSMKAPVFVTPAMDIDMYQHPSTRKNLEILRSYGNYIIDAESGELASHLIGKGRMAEPEHIVRLLELFFAKPEGILSKKKILITAGPTYEKIDPVRFIGNYSSGKMGYALAEECAERGADVILISGPTNLNVRNKNITLIRVESAEEMYQCSLKYFPSVFAAILCAAVSDFTPSKRFDQKIKRGTDGLSLQLRPTKDIAEALGRLKEKQKLIGFALETEQEVTFALTKMKKKNFDFIVLNSLRDEGACFQTDTNKIKIISSSGVKEYPLKPKTMVAKDIIDELCLLGR